MMRIIKTVFIIFGLLFLFVIWYWINREDYFKKNYRDLTITEKSLFRWQDSSDYNLKSAYEKHFADTTFLFPRQHVKTIKLFKNILILDIFTSKTLKQELNNSFISFCNDQRNFGWEETTWSINEAEYYVRLYDNNNRVIGKIYFCLKDCGMIKARPFCPLMKSGKLSASGQNKIENLIADNTNWQ